MLKQVTQFTDIKFQGVIQMDGWIFHCDGLSVRHEKNLAKREYFNTEEEMIKWAEKKFNYRIKQCEKKNITPSVFVNYNPWF